jgi:hypothetical protein
VILAAHGLAIELPKGWSGRVFRRAGGNATLHAGDFGVALDDGEFGDRSTGAMPPDSSFMALVEYIPGAGLEPGRGLFSATRIPRRLDLTAFGTARLAHPRPGQVGTQHFFTADGRPLCLYVVLAGPRAIRRRQLAVLDHVLGTLRVAPPVGRR